MQVRTAEVSTAELSAQLLELWARLMRGTGGRLFEIVEELDLSLLHMKALNALGDCEQPLAVKQVAEELGSSLPSASRAVDALLRRGLLVREEDPDDRRVRRVALTAAGEQALLRIESARLSGLEQYLSTLSPEQRSRLSAALVDLPLNP